MRDPILLALQTRAERITIEVDGVPQIWHVWNRSHPQPLVLLHGGSGSWTHWVRNIDALAQERTVWVPDMPGFGESEDLPGDPHQPGREQQVVEALSATLEELLPTSASVDMVGFSFGGYVAAEFAALSPRVQRLTLLGTAAHGGARRMTMELLNWRLSDPTQMREALVHNLSALMLHDPAQIDELAVSAHGMSCLRTRFRSKDVSRAAGLPGALNRFDGPTVMLWGEHDVTAVPETIGPQLVDTHCHRHWAVLPGAGHWVQFESARAVNRMLLDA